jgi:hypothetical protein
MGRDNRLLFLIALALSITLQVSGARAGEAIQTAAGLRLTCENGRDYPIRAGAVSVEGELVAGRLIVSPRHSVHIRLVPMGVGYRYAGRGVWFDGTRGLVWLYFGKSHPIACRVVIAPPTARLAVR